MKTLSARRRPFFQTPRSIVFLATVAFLSGAASLWSFDGKEDLSVFSQDRMDTSTHFRIHHEASSPPPGIVTVLEGLHAKLLLELGSFSPWAYSEKIDLYLYSDADHYHTATHMPPWAGAHIDAMGRKIYAYPSENFQRVLAHEMGHLFFTQYFIAKSTVPPLWLNEGVATLMEWNYGGEAETSDQDHYLLKKGPLPFDQFLSQNYRTAGASEGEAVSLWYLQAGGLTRFLKHRFSAQQFLFFCDALRQGQSLDESLSAGYGFSIPNATALEALWRASLLEKTP